MKPVLITVNAVSYRTPLYNLLVREHGYRVIILTTKKGDEANLDDAIEVISTRRFLGFLYPSEKIDLSTAKTIIAFFDLWLLPWITFKIDLKRVVFWGIGVGNGALGNLVRKYALKRSKCLFSYMPSGQVLTDNQAGQRNAYLINSVFVPKPEPLWQASNKLVFLGTIDRRKRLDVLVHAIQHLKEMGENWSVTIIGDGNALPGIKDLVQMLSLEDRITFTGRINSDEGKKAALSGAFLTVLPGQSGLSVLESFAYGLPVLTWAEAISGGENDNVVDGVTGFLTRKLCAVQFAQTLSRLSQTPERVGDASKMCHHYYVSTASGDMMLKRFVAHVDHVSGATTGTNLSKNRPGLSKE